MKFKSLQYILLSSVFLCCQAFGKMNTRIVSSTITFNKIKVETPISNNLSYSNENKGVISKLKNSTVLLYTKNGKGYVHDNIAASVNFIKSLGESEHFNVEVSEDPSVFTEASLKKYNLIIFSSTMAS